MTKPLISTDDTDYTADDHNAIREAGMDIAAIDHAIADTKAFLETAPDGDAHIPFRTAYRDRLEDLGQQRESAVHQLETLLDLMPAEEMGRA